MSYEDLYERAESVLLQKEFFEDHPNKINENNMREFLLNALRLYEDIYDRPYDNKDKLLSILGK